MPNLANATNKPVDTSSVEQDFMNVYGTCCPCGESCVSEPPKPTSAYTYNYNPSYLDNRRYKRLCPRDAAGVATAGFGDMTDAQTGGVAVTAIGSTVMTLSYLGYIHPAWQFVAILPTAFGALEFIAATHDK